ncbi:hypothetical protein ANCDUO_08643 [Ancylostoma duodenale]|uniref:Uncharacterized protein n=1 Tax=Ancylostoma duodenale TaxID=51022 RepID=A0A0C2DF68_9BILA|nr:hypothetical protein ANCDUO_08643 [Ancylostoma duodenale]
MANLPSKIPIKKEEKPPAWEVFPQTGTIHSCSWTTQSAAMNGVQRPRSLSRITVGTVSESETEYLDATEHVT